MASVRVEQLAEPPPPTLVTEEIIEGLNSGKVVADDVGATIPGISGANYHSFVYELAWGVAQAGLEPQKFPVAVKAAGVVEDSEEVLVNTFWYVWQELGGGGDVKADSSSLQISEELQAKRRRLADACRACLSQELLDKRALQDTQDFDFLGEIGVFSNITRFKSAQVRWHTKTFYKQSKFNLLREETEGYSKAVAMLNLKGAGALCDDTVPFVKAELVKLIGFFELDPNRVLDLALEAFEQQPDNTAFLQLMPLFKADAADHVMGFKLLQYQRELPAEWAVAPEKGAKPVVPTPPAADQEAPRNLYKVMARLVVAGVCSLEGLLAHMAPARDQDLEEAARAAEKALHSAAERGERDGAVPLDPSDLNSRAKRSSNAFNSEVMDLDVRPLDAVTQHLGRGFQKVQLVCGLLEVDEWPLAKRLLDHLAALQLTAAAVPDVGQSFCKLLWSRCAPLQSVLDPKGCFGPCVLDGKVAVAKAAAEQVLARFPDDLHDILQYLGLYLFRDLPLLTRLLQLLRLLLLQLNSTPGGGLAAPNGRDRAPREALMQTLMRCIVPACMMVPANVAIASHLWQLLQQLHYTERFRIYTHVNEVERKERGLLRAAHECSSCATRRLMKRVTLPKDKADRRDFVRPISRMLAKIAHSQPFAAMQHVLANIMKFQAMKEAVVETMQLYQLPWTFDVLEYLLLTTMANPPQRRMKEDGEFLEDWLQNLCAFAAALVRKGHLGVVPLLQYVKMRLFSGDSVELDLFVQTLQSVTGLMPLEEVSDEQLQSLAGGEVLAAEVLLADRHMSRKAVRRNMDSLLQLISQGDVRPWETASETSDGPQELVRSMLILLIQQRELCLAEEEAISVKAVASARDALDSALHSYTLFLQQSMDPNAYEAMLPSMTQLVMSYGCPPETAWALYRPVLGRMKIAHLIASLEPEEGQVQDGPEASAAAGTKPVDAEAPAASLSYRDVVEHVRTIAAAGRRRRAAKLAELEAAEAGVADGDAAPLEEALCENLHILFWSLRLQDIHTPSARYANTVEQLKRELVDVETKQAQLVKEKEAKKRERDGERRARYDDRYHQDDLSGILDEVGILEEEEANLKRVRPRIEDTLAKLPGECAAQEQHVAAVLEEVKTVSGQLLSKLPSKSRRDFASIFIQECLLPRLLTGGEDAVYCIKFVVMLQSMRTPFFHTLSIYDRLLSKFLPRMLLSSTERETQNVAVAMLELLRLVEGWRNDPRAFKAECEGCPGFSGTVSGSGSGSDGCNHLAFKQLCHKWQSRITHFFRNFLKSKDYLPRRNVLKVLLKIQDYYPGTRAMMTTILELVADVSETELRPDLKHAAATLVVRLQKQMKTPERIKDPGRDFGVDARKEEKRARGAAAKRLQSTPPAAAAAAAAAAGTAASPKKPDGGGGSGGAAPAGAAAQQRGAREGLEAAAGVEADRERAGGHKRDRDGKEKERAAAGRDAAAAEGERDACADSDRKSSGKDAARGKRKDRDSTAKAATAAAGGGGRDGSAVAHDDKRPRTQDGGRSGAGGAESSRAAASERSGRTSNSLPRPAAAASAPGRSGSASSQQPEEGEVVALPTEAPAPSHRSSRRERDRDRDRDRKSKDKSKDRDRERGRDRGDGEAGTGRDGDAGGGAENGTGAAGSRASGRHQPVRVPVPRSNDNRGETGGPQEAPYRSSHRRSGR